MSRVSTKALEALAETNPLASVCLAQRRRIVALEAATSDILERQVRSLRLELDRARREIAALKSR